MSIEVICMLLSGASLCLIYETLKRIDKLQEDLREMNKKVMTLTDKTCGYREEKLKDELAEIENNLWPYPS
jgi:hypothetical protein